jgi:hypothetical protein
MMIRRYIRLAWIIALNGYVISLHVGSMQGRSQLYHLLEKRPPWTEFIGGSLGILILAAGIACEVFRFRRARWINIGYFLVMGGFFTLAGIIGRREPEAWVFVPQVGLPALAAATVTSALYWSKSAREAPRGDHTPPTIL